MKHLRGFTRFIQVSHAALVALTLSGTNYAQQASTSQDRVAPQRSPQARYCVTYHLTREKDWGVVPIALDNVNRSIIAADAELWEKVIKKVEAGLMPPSGVARPDASSTRQFVSWLETQLDESAQAHPNPGRPLIHRLNRTE